MPERERCAQADTRLLRSCYETNPRSRRPRAQQVPPATGAAGRITGMIAWFELRRTRSSHRLAFATDLVRQAGMHLYG